MDSRVTTAEPQHSYLYQSTNSSWNGRSTTPTTAPSTGQPLHSTSSIKASTANRNPSSLPSLSHATTPATATTTVPQLTSQFSDGPADLNTAPAASVTGQFPPQIDFLHYYQSHLHYVQLLHYNKLVSRGGGLQTPPLPTVVSSSHAQAGPRSRSSSKVSLKDSSSGKGSNSGGHGSRSNHSPDKNRSVIIPKEASRSKMPSKNAPTHAHPAESAGKSQASRGPPPTVTNNAQSQPALSSSVPSTPHQRARQFSFESREPSPNENTNGHSPRSAYSETNSTLPSLRPLPPPRHGGCKYETSQINSRRRIPYSNGNEPLKQMDLGKIKGNLTPEEERKVATDMREIYDRLLPNEQVEEKRRKLVQKLETIFNEEWPGHDIRAHLFGSSGNLLCSDDSDVDVCITTPWQELEGVCMIADLLARRGMEKVVCISAAKVPIVKMWDPELELSCDMNVNNTLALENTRMIRIYIEIDPRVRQLAMIIKHWTKRRIVNDAAFGGTLSSYTWICLIIAFLQLRTPPVLPTLHALPYKTSRPGSPPSAFADNLKRLKGLGEANKSSVADLLFQFFRFYAHEFNYDKWVLSVRLGKLMTKSDKNWEHALNNRLCVEEPFNTSRNLGNTVDEYSFRGLHQELRRAFDLISAANVEEACEQYVFPKEEERVWSRPPPQPRPVMLRSASQTHTGSGRGGRGGNRGGRHNNYRGGGNNGPGGAGAGSAGGNTPNRRSSSSVPNYDQTLFATAMGLPQDLSWFQGGQFPIQYTPEMLAQLAYQQQQENLRQFQQLYAQNPLYSQIQNMTGHPGMGAGQGQGQTQGQTQSTDRSRAGSFDNPPLSAPLRPDLYALYGMTLGQPFFTQPAKGYGTYPSSPATTNAAGQDYRRPLQRSTVHTEKGASASSSSLRSQSQPAARSQSAGPGGVNGHHPLSTSQSTTNVSAYDPRNGHANGIAIPTFVSPEDDTDETPKASSVSPQSDEERKYMAYFNNSESPKPVPNILHQQPPPAQTVVNGVTFGDLAHRSVNSSGSTSRRLSGEQLPQSLLERRIKRSSRSPSPLGHARTQSTGARPPSAAATAAANHAAQASSRPLVVNGSNGVHSLAATSRQLGTTESATPSTGSVESSPRKPQVTQTTPVDAPPASVPAAVPEQQALPTDRPPLVVNGSNNNVSRHQQNDDSSFRERISMLSTQYMSPQAAPQDTSMFRNGNLAALPARQMMPYQPQAAGIAPLDLAIGDRRPIGPDVSLLSPVYETRTPSPTVARKLEGKLDRPGNALHGEQKKSNWTKTSPVEGGNGPESSPETQRHAKGSRLGNQPAKTNGANGHTRVVSESGWQKAGKNKKKGAGNNNNSNSQQQQQQQPQQPVQAEQPPKRDSERKGG